MQYFFLNLILLANFLTWVKCDLLRDFLFLILSMPDDIFLIDIFQMSYYTAFEVMECSWDELMKRLKTAENLDEVIDAHDEFLNSVVRRALLGELTRDLLTQLRAIYDRVVEFDSVQNRLYLEALAEADARKGVVDNSRSKSAAALDDEDLERRHTFAMEVMPKLETQLRIVSQSYQDMVRNFLLQLTVSQDQSLQCLSFRLDFNTHYNRKDSRLGVPLTFQQRQFSM